MHTIPRATAYHAEEYRLKMPTNNVSSTAGQQHRWDHLQELVARYGAPLYIYDLAEFDRRLDELQAVLPPGAKLLYSAKANPALLSQAAARSLPVEASSIHEINQALAVDVPAIDLLFGGPGKTPEELGTALQCGVSWFSVESVRELEELNQLAKQSGVRPSVLLRINPVQATTAGLSMSGVPSQFGIPEEQIDEQRLRILDCSHLDIAGAHVYMGTQIQSVEVLAEAFQLGVVTYQRVSASLGLHLPILNLGGGFSWPYATRGATDLTPLRDLLAPLLAPLQRDGVQPWFESGRYLAASCGTLVSRVINVKICRDTHYLVLDAGIHCLGGMSGLGRTARRHMNFLTAYAVDEPSFQAVVVGPSCTPLDILCTGVSIPARLRPMDLVQVPNVGAYGLTASLIGFLGRTLPIEVFIRDREVIRALSLSCHHTEI